jgi:putative adenylate-forming enzyme
MILKGIGDYISLTWNQRHRSFESPRRYQESKALKMVDYAMKHSEFYKKYYGETSIDSIEDFHRLPTINKEVMMEHYDGLNTCGLNLHDVMGYAVEKELNQDYLGYYMDHYVVGLSSGTSGNKGIYVTPKEMTNRLPFVFLARSGIPVKLLPYRILFMLRVFSQGFDDINAPLIKLNYMSTMTPIDEVIETINRQRINILMAPPSLIRLLIPHIDKILVPIEMIVTYAEVLEKEEKERFERFFESKVIEIYQASEGQIGSACKAGNLHINEDLVYVELFDHEGNRIEEPHQRASRMLVTNLVNKAQPLIRYEMNDLIVLGKPCSCGSSFRVIDRIVGRNDDVMYFNNRRDEVQHVFPDLISRWIITTSDLIREFKVIQHQDESIEVIIDCLEESVEVRELIESELKDRMVKEMGRFEIDPVISLRFEAIELPQNQSKCQRFFKI